MATDAIEINRKFREFESLRDQLEVTLSIHDKNQNLFAHIQEVLRHIVLHYPSEALNKLEEISYLLKHQNIIAIHEFLKINSTLLYAQPADEETKQQTTENIKSASALFVKQMTTNDDGEQVEVEPSTSGNVPDLQAEAKIWSWGGVGFGDYDIMILQKSLTRLAQSSGATSLKLWGKIRGIKADYYIAEGTLDGGEGEGDDGPQQTEQVEQRGTGVNKFVYWVCNSPLSSWTKLADLKPSDIIKARQIKYTFSGDLNNDIFTNPFYHEKESTYLRAQIARISASTTLVPKTLYRFVEETDQREIEENNPEEGEIAKPSVQAMVKQDMWLHFNQSILNQGRTKHLPGQPIPGEEEVDEEELKKREIAKDPWEPRLKPITQDKNIQGGLPAWTLRFFGTDKNFEDPKTKKATQNYGCVVVKSNWWPGAISFYANNKSYMIYNGDGLKKDSKTFYPVLPPTMHEDKAEKKTYDEPNPTENWLRKKAELDLKKKKDVEE